jgi:hypothetical protein
MGRRSPASLKNLNVLGILFPCRGKNIPGGFSWIHGSGQAFSCLKGDVDHFWQLVVETESGLVAFESERRDRETARGFAAAAVDVDHSWELVIETESGAIAFVCKAGNFGAQLAPFGDQIDHTRLSVVETKTRFFVWERVDATFAAELVLTVLVFDIDHVIDPVVRTETSGLAGEGKGRLLAASVEMAPLLSRGHSGFLVDGAVLARVVVESKRGPFVTQLKKAFLVAHVHHLRQAVVGTESGAVVLEAIQCTARTIGLFAPFRGLGVQLSSFGGFLFLATSKGVPGQAAIHG